MDIIFSTFRDLVKFKIISNINTGDKTGDATFGAFYIAIITFLLNIELWRYI